MSDEKKHLREKLNCLTDELIDNIINTPDAEILNEIEEDYGDSSIVANRVREILKKSQIRARGNSIDGGYLNFFDGEGK